MHTITDLSSEFEFFACEKEIPFCTDVYAKKYVVYVRFERRIFEQFRQQNRVQIEWAMCVMQKLSQQLYVFARTHTSTKNKWTLNHNIV